VKVLETQLQEAKDEIEKERKEQISLRMESEDKLINLEKSIVEEIRKRKNG